MTKFMKPSDCTRYAKINAQAIREGLKREKLPFGWCVKRENRWAYYIVPSQFFSWLGTEIPTEWR